ncbi:Arm DNA-binding domain-containing protein [Enterobacteriaceae bacterium TYF_5]
MALSDIAARNAKPSKKMYKLTDEYGLYLQVNPAGTVYLPHHCS